MRPRFSATFGLLVTIGAFAFANLPADERQASQGTAGTAPESLPPACVEADRARVAQLMPLLHRNRPADPAVLERALHALNVARRHCQYGWVDRALSDYRWLENWLAEQG